MYNLSIFITNEDRTFIKIIRTNTINHNYVTTRFVEGHDIVGLYISHQLGNQILDSLVIDIGHTISDVTYVPDLKKYNIESMEKTHMYFWNNKGFVKQVSIDNGRLHYYNVTTTPTYLITTGASIECLQTLRGLTRHDIDCHITLEVDNDGHILRK